MAGDARPGDPGRPGRALDAAAAARRRHPERGRRRRPFVRSWWRDWRGERCVIVAGGPSAKGAHVGQAKGRCRAVAINEGWRLAPWADVLYGCDGTWWNAAKGAPRFAGLKLSQHLGACARYPDLNHVALIDGCDELTVDTPGRIGSGGNSGFQALNLAVQFGARTIILVGYDMHVGAGVHWHGRHPAGMNNPDPVNTAAWRARLDAQSGRLAALGVTVLNASPGSALAAFPKMTLEEALDVTEPPPPA